MNHTEKVCQKSENPSGSNNYSRCESQQNGKHQAK